MKTVSWIEATYNKNYSRGDRQVTLRDKVSRLINSSWIYSRHWKHETWVEQAKVDCASRIVEVSQELKQLELAKELLDSVGSRA